MAKEKKISFRYYLNTGLKSLPIKGVDRYPVYLKVTFNRRNTSYPFPLLYADGYLSKEDFSRFFDLRINDFVNGQIEDFEAVTEKIIRAEFSYLKEDEFVLAGIGKRYFRYYDPILDILEKENKGRILQSFLNREETFVSGFFNDDFRIYKTWSLLENHFGVTIWDKIPLDTKKNFSAIILLSSFLFSEVLDTSEGVVFTCLDWIENSKKEAFKAFISKGLYNDPIEKVDKVWRDWKGRFLTGNPNADEVILAIDSMVFKGVQR